MKKQKQLTITSDGQALTINDPSGYSVGWGFLYYIILYILYANFI